ncbi:Protein white [Gryllus bimaculatus]|nr:Protein white [Gryllus bimaculatus]
MCFAATGAVAPGGLTALMGGSGAGKSSLMAALAHRLPAGLTADGDIRVNGRPVGDFMHRLSGYMHQEDLFVAELTVREHLTFMRCKRMLTDPPLLFCDEPTTGLDAYSAHKLVHMMQRVALQGRTVLCTIHQPSSELFALFHQLVLVADGRVVFIGDAPSALDFFAGHGYRCPEAYNPAEFFMRALALTPGSEESSRVAIRRLCEHFAVSDAARRVDLTVRLQQRLGDAEEHKALLSKHVW